MQCIYTMQCLPKFQWPFFFFVTEIQTHSKIHMELQGVMKRQKNLEMNNKVGGLTILISKFTTQLQNVQQVELPHITSGNVQ